jgi:hypothetical protein
MKKANTICPECLQMMQEIPCSVCNEPVLVCGCHFSTDLCRDCEEEGELRQIEDEELDEEGEKEYE